jgi:hypothetical protein
VKNLLIKIRDINALAPTTVVGILTRLSWGDSGSDSSIRQELHKRYVEPTPGPHPNMAMALIFIDAVLVGWVGTRPWPEKFKGKSITAQTVECFVDPKFRRRGLAKLGLHALIAADKIDRNDFVSVYAANVVKLAESCGCKTVLLCES